MGLGFVLGPAFGIGLYIIGGYRFIFFTLGSVFIIIGLFIKKTIKEEVDRNIM